MDEVEASMMSTTNAEQGGAGDAAMAASHTHQPELSPTRVERADPDQPTSAEKPKKKKKACPSEASSDDDAAMAATPAAMLPEIDLTAVDDDAAHLLRHSMTARGRSRGMSALMADVAAASHPTQLPEGQSGLDTAADAIAAAIAARPGEAAARSSPPREHIRMAPHLQPAARAGAWQVWEKRGGTSNSNSTDASAPPSPRKAKAPDAAGITTANRFEAISEEPRVSRASRVGGKGGRFWGVVIALLTALTDTAYRGTNASHEWHDQPVLTRLQVTPFSSQELKGTWAELESTMGGQGVSNAAMVERAMKVMSFRERVMATDNVTLADAVNDYFADCVKEMKGGTPTRQATIVSWLRRNEHVAQPNAKRPETAPVVAVAEPTRSTYTIPRSTTSQAKQAPGSTGQATPPPSRKQTQRVSFASSEEAGPSSAVDPRSTPPPATAEGEAGEGGVDKDSEEYLNEKVLVMVGNPANELVIAEDQIALQFGEHMYDQEVPNFDDMLAAECVGRGGKGPWVIAIPRFAAQVALLTVNRQWTAYSTDGSEAQLTTWPCDKQGNKVLHSRPENRERAQEKEQSNQKREEAKVMIIINAPRRFVGSQLKKGEMQPIVAQIRNVLQKVEGIQFGIAQGMTAEFRKPRNALNVFINPALEGEDPLETVRAVLPQLKYLPIRESSFHVEPAVAFIPTDMIKKLGVTRCCFRREEVCEAQQVGGSCTYRTQQELAMGYMASLFKPQRSYEGPNGYEGGERKRKREEQAATAVTKIEAAKQQRLQNILGKLCKLHREGKVRLASMYACRERATPQWMCCTHAVCARRRVQQPAQQRRGTQAHLVHVGKGRWRHVLLLEGHVPVRPAQHGEGERDRDGALRRGCDAAGRRGGTPGWPANRPGKPERGNERGRLRQLPRNTREFPPEACEAAGVWKMRCANRLADRVQASRRGDRAQEGSGMWQQTMLTPIPQGRTHTCAAKVYRWRGKRRTQADANAAQHRGFSMAHDVTRRSRKGARTRNTADCALKHETDMRDIHHWHTKNILWLKGRLPWHKVTYYA
jgi:hypothetical protein